MHPLRTWWSVTVCYQILHTQITTRHVLSHPHLFIHHLVKNWNYISKRLEDVLVCYVLEMFIPTDRKTIWNGYNVAQKCDSVCFWSVFTNRKLCTSFVVLWETSPKCWQPSGSESSTPGGGATTVRTSVDVLVKGSGHTISCFVVSVLVSGAGFSASLATPFFSSSLGRLVLVPEWASLRMRQIKM